DQWLADNKLQWVTEARQTVGDLLKTRGERSLLIISPSESVASAIDTLRSAGISQLPVLDQGKPVGSVQEVTLARILHDHRDPETIAVGDIMAKPLPLVEASTNLDEAYRLLLAGNTGVLAVHEGEVLGIVTRIDLINYWNPVRKDPTK
ncbi:MAG: CBS domain-containing protein, partial [Planctomycetota bacterium]